MYMYMYIVHVFIDSIRILGFRCLWLAAVTRFLYMYCYHMFPIHVLLPHVPYTCTATTCSLYMYCYHMFPIYVLLPHVPCVGVCYMALVYTCTCPSLHSHLHLMVTFISWSASSHSHLHLMVTFISWSPSSHGHLHLMVSFIS